jgi:hemoglobin
MTATITLRTPATAAKRELENDAILRGPEQRLRDFLIFRFGGPPRYIEDRGHPQLRMRHAPFPIAKPARDRWFRLMEAALEETIPPSEAKQLLRAFFESTTTFLINRAPD